MLEQVDDSRAPAMSKTQYVLGRLRRDIERGAVSPGDALRQTDLATRYGVSPTPVREALRILEAEGTVLYSPHKGATVAQLDARSIADLYELRASMESLATRLSVDRMDADGEAEILTLHHQLSGAIGLEDPARLSRWNRELHFAIYAKGSPIIASLLTSQWRLFPPQVTIWEREESARLLDAQHVEILDALVKRDSDRAASLMSEHIHTARRLRTESQRA
jgi:DNA-binding GntR family transcriptional regulator